MNLITVEEYKEYNEMSSNPKEDGKIGLLIESVSSLIQAYLGTSFEGGKIVEEVISVDYETNQIFLDNYPIEEVISVSESNRVTTDSTVHVPLIYIGDYYVDKEDGILIRNYTTTSFGTWPISPGVVVIKYKTGAKWPSINGRVSFPADLKLAAIELVTYYRKEEYRQSKTVQGASIVNTLAQGDADFPKHIQVILDRYK